MKPPVLHIGASHTTGIAFCLSLDLVTQSIAVLAKRGVGKTYTAAVISEEIHDAGVPPIIVDPTGAHWGLKSSADGKKPGLPFVVFGGEHADLPLEESAGEVIARAIVENRFPAILDLSLLRKGAMHRFLIGFFETLYRTNRQALHLVCDEADVYAPQKPFGEEARTLGAMQDIVRRGRIRGIGCTLITQRPQVLNKDVLTQCEVLAVMRLIHPKDINAIGEWIAVHGDTQKARDLIASLPSLPVGQAWFWWPALEIFDRVAVRRRRTFDSSATPKPGEVRVSPEKFAAVDIARLGADIEATAQRAKENDPAALKARIRELQTELAKAPVSPAPERVEVPVLSEIHAARLQTLIATAQDLVRHAGDLRTDVLAAMQRIAGRGGAAPTGVAPNRADKGQAPREAALPRTDARDARPQPASAGSPLPRAERLILTCLAQHGPCMKNKIAAISGYAVTGGGFQNALSALRGKGFIAPHEPHDITPAGRAALGAFDPLPTGDALIAKWVRDLAKAEGMILQQLCRAYPKSLTKDELAAFTGYQADGGGFGNALSRLRTLELITGRGELRASDNLFAA